MRRDPRHTPLASYADPPCTKPRIREISAALQCLGRGGDDRTGLVHGASQRSADRIDRRRIAADEESCMGDGWADWLTGRFQHMKTKINGTKMY